MKKFYFLEKKNRPGVGSDLNASKCYIMSIYRNQNPLTYTYTLDNHILEKVNNNLYLGVLISDDLKWATHINKICNRANSTLGFTKRNLKNCDKKFKESAYFSLVCSVLDHSSTIWDPYHQKDINRIETLQRRAARFVQKDYKRTSSVTSMMEELGWKPLHERRREQSLILLYKIVNDLVAIPADQHITSWIIKLPGFASYLFYQYHCLRVNRVYAGINTFLPPY